MRVLETILHFLTTLARIIFPRLPKPAAGDCPCPNPLPLPDGNHPPLPPAEGDRSDTDGHRSDTLALHQGDWGGQPSIEPIDIAGYCLMAAGGIGCLCKLFAV